MRPNAQVRYTGVEGKLSLEGLRYFDDLAREIEALRTEVDSLKIQVADHEARITALEP